MLLLALLCLLPQQGIYCQSSATNRRSGPQNLPSRVEQVENAGLLFTDNPAGVSGVDAGYSLAMGRQTLWLFGDVFLLDPTAPSKPYVGAVSNCALLVPAGSGVTPLRDYTFLTDPKTGLARQVMPLTTEDKKSEDSKTIRYWPFGGWYDSATKRVYLYYGRIRTSGSGPFDFHIDGHGLAVAEAAAPAAFQFRYLNAMKNSTADAGPKQALWWTGAANAPLFGSAVITAKVEKKIEKIGVSSSADYLYVAGVQERDGHKYGKMARVLKNKITDMGAYDYFTGGTDAPRWSHAIAEAADVSSLHDFPNELSIAYNTYLGGYLAVQSVGITDKIRLSLAPHPWGPYTPLAEIGAPHRAFAHAFCYAGKEHPELAQDQGRIIYVTYVDSDRYWLQLLKITLQKQPQTAP